MNRVNSGFERRPTAHGKFGCYASSFSIVAGRSNGMRNFSITELAPSRKAAWRYSGLPKAPEMARMGRAAVFFRIAQIVSMPSTRGITRSVMARSTVRCSRSWSAALPSEASTTEYPCSSRRARRNVRKISSSSTIRTVFGIMPLEALVAPSVPLLPCFLIFLVIGQNEQSMNAADKPFRERLLQLPMLRVLDRGSWRIQPCQRPTSRIQE